MRGLGLAGAPGQRQRAIADHVAARSQVATGPLPHVLVGEVRHRRQAHVQGTAIDACLHRSDEGRLVGRLGPAVDVACLGHLQRHPLRCQPLDPLALAYGKVGFAIEPIHTLVIDARKLRAQQVMDASVAKASAGLGNLDDPACESRVAASTSGGRR